MQDGGSPESSVVRPKREVIQYGPLSYAVGYKGYGTVDIISEQLRNHGGPDEAVVRLVSESGTRYTISLQSGFMMTERRVEGQPIDKPEFDEPKFSEIDIDKLSYITLGEPCPLIPGQERIRTLLMSAYAGAVENEPNKLDYRGEENPLVRAQQQLVQAEVKH